MSTLEDVVKANSRSVCATGPEATVLSAVQQMCRFHVRALLVGDLADPIGIISERDILERVVLANLDPKATCVGTVMTTPLVLLPASSSPSEALEFMRHHRLHQIPILSEEAVTGVVSSTDLLRWAEGSLKYEVRRLTEYCSGKYPG